MYGSHLSIAGGMHHALTAARSMSMDCVQVFTKNQRQWNASPLSDEAIGLWNRHRQETGIAEVVSHDSYLINLAHAETGAWKKSLAAFRDELERCEALGIPHLVTHPGAHLGTGEEAGLKRVAEALDELHRELPGYKTVTCLEVTAGQGSCLGARFEHIAQVLDTIQSPERVAVCLDTAHMIEAGYDLTSGAGAEETLEELDRIVGLERVRVIHINDSKTPRGSRVDRHAHIGQGHVSIEAFRVFVNRSEFASVPKILETPKDTAPDGRPWDVVNLEVLHGLINPLSVKTPPARTKKHSGASGGRKT